MQFFPTRTVRATTSTVLIVHSTRTFMKIRTQKTFTVGTGIAMQMQGAQRCAHAVRQKILKLISERPRSLSKLINQV